MKKVLLILFICLSSCKKEDSSAIKIHRTLSLPTITVIIKGEPVEMIMDTGGAVTILDDDLAKELDILPTEESIELRGYGGPKSIVLAEEVELTIGETDLQGDVHVSDIDNITRTKQVRGILGMPHLQNAVIDLKNNTITFE